MKSPAKVYCVPERSCKPNLSGAALGTEEGSPKYQYGGGCLSDQLLGQLNAHLAGLGYLLNPQRVRMALKSIYIYNFRPHIGSFNNVQQALALGDEAGLLLCTWPNDDRPALPFPYCDEVWTGVDYQVAAHLIYEGFIDEGLALVKAVRDRYAGFNRNPWDAIECGHHYARALASWGVKIALDGFTFDLPDKRLGFAPKLNQENYSTFWSTGTGWGDYYQEPRKGAFTLKVLYGSQTIKRLDLANLQPGKLTVTGPAGVLPARLEGKAVILDSAFTLGAGQSLKVNVVR